MVRVLSSSSSWRFLIYFWGQTCSDTGVRRAWRHQGLRAFLLLWGRLFTRGRRLLIPVALPHLWQSTLPIPSLCLQNIYVTHLPYRAGAEPSPYLTYAEGLRASTRQYCAHGVVYGELLLQPTACFKDLVVQASWASPYGWYLRQVLSALLDRSREFGLRLLRV